MSAMECHGLPWSAMECHGVPWIAVDCRGLPLMAIDCRGSPRAQMSTVDEMNKSSVLAEKQKKRMMRFLEVVNVLVKGLPAHEVCAHSQRAAMECTDSTGAAVFICRDERAKDVLPPGKVDLDAFLGDEKKPGADKEGGGDRGLRRQSSMSAVVDESVAIEIEALRNDAYTQQAQLQASLSYGVVKEAELVQVMATDGE